MSSKNKTKSQSPSKSWVSELPDSDEDTECVDIEEPSNAKLSVPENCTCCNMNDTRDEYIMALLSRGVHAKDACNSEPAGKVKSATQTTKIATQIDKLLDSINVNEIAEKCKFAPFSQLYDDDLFNARFVADEETKFLNTLNDSEEQKNFFLKPNWSDGYEDDEYDSDQEEDEDILYSEWKEKPSLRDTLHQFFLIKKWRNSDNPGENLMLEVLKSNTEHQMSDDEHYPHLQGASKKKKVKKKRAASVAAFASALKKPASLDEMDKLDTGKHVQKTETSKAVEKTEKPALVDKPETSKDVDGKSCPPPPPSVVDEKTKMIMNFQLAVREGTDFFLKCEYARCADSYKRVRKDFADVLRNTCSVQERCIFTYIFCLSRVLTHSYEEIIDSLHDLKVDLPASFHLKSYGVAVAYQSLNRHSTALEHVRAALKSCADVQKMFYPYCYCQYLSVPSVNGKPPPASQPSATVKKCSCNLIALPESNPDQLKSRLEELHRDCNVPRVATARCKYENCLRISTHVEPSHLIFTTDPDFSGYVCVYCEERCRIEYHHHCWKAYKESTALDVAVKLSDKDFIGKHCPTEDCKTSHNSPSCIVKINIFGADNEIKSSQTKPTAGIIMTGGSRRRDEDDEKSAVVGAGKKNKKKEEEEEKCGGKKKKQRVDSVESTPVKKAKKKEVVIGEKSNKASRDGDASVKRKENDDDREEEKVEEVVPQKKGKHKKIKYFCIDGFNRGASGSNKHPQPPSSKVQGRTTAVKSSDTQAARYFVLSLEEELELLAMLRENRFGIPFQDWMDVSDDYFGNSGLVKDLLVEERYSRTLSEVQKLLLDLYRSYLKEQSPKFGLDILNHVEKTFWNLSWTPARDFLSSFDPIASSGVYKTVSQFLSSSGEFVIIGDKLCLAQYLSFCVESVVNRLDVSFILDSEHVVKAGREYIVEVEEDEDVRKQVFVHVKEVEETKLKTELSLFGKVKRVDQLKERKPGKRAHSSDSLTHLLVTFSDTFAAEAARKYSRHIVYPVASAKPFMSASGKTRVYTESPIYNVNSVAKASTASESSANSISCFQDNVPRGMNVKDDRSATHVTSEKNSLGSETQSVWSESQSICSESQSICSESQSVCSGAAGDVELDGDYEDTTSMGTEENDEVEGNNQEILENEPFDTVQKFEQTPYENTEEKLYENNEETLFENNEDTLENTEEALYDNNEETLCENNEEKFENTEEKLYENNEETLFENNEDTLENTEEVLNDNNEETLCENNEHKLENTEEVLYDNNEETLCENNEEKFENTEEVLNDNNEETLCENNEEKFENTEEALCENVGKTQCTNVESEKQLLDTVENVSELKLISECNENKLTSQEMETSQISHEENYENTSEILDSGIENIGGQHLLVEDPNDMNTPDDDENNENLTSMDIAQVVRHGTNVEGETVETDEKEQEEVCSNVVENNIDTNDRQTDYSNERKPSTDYNHSVDVIPSDQYEQQVQDLSEKHEEEKNDISNIVKAWEENSDNERTDSDNENIPSLGEDSNDHDEACETNTTRSNLNVKSCEFQPNASAHVDIASVDSEASERRISLNNSECEAYTYDSNESRPHSNLNVNSAEFAPNTSLSRKVDDHESEVYETNTNSNEPYCLDELKLAIPNTWTCNKVEQSRPHSNLNINSPAFTPRSSFSNPNDDDDNEVCVINKTFDNLKYKHEPLNVANPNTNSDDTNDPPRPHSNFNVNSPEFTPNMSSCLISPQSHNFNILDFLSEKVNVPEFRPNTMALNIDDIPEFKPQPNNLNVNSPDFKPQGNTSDGNVLEFQPLPESISDSESEVYIPPVTSAAFPATSVEFTPWGDDDSSEKSEYYDDFVDHEDQSDSEYSGDEIGPFDQFPVESNVAAVIIGNNVEEYHGNASNAKNLYSESYSYTSNNHELDDLEKRIPITCEVGTSNGEFWKQNDNLKDKIVNLRTESSIEIKKLKHIILEKQKKHCDAIIDNLTDKCRDKLSQWDIFRSSFLTESNKSHKIWALLEKEEAAWEIRMISTREQADLVEQEYKTHLSSLHTVDANDIGFSLLSQPPKFLSEDTSMSRYEKLYKTALKLHTGDNSTDDDSEDEFSFNQEDTADEVSDEQQDEASLDQRESTEDEVSLNQESIENEVNHKQPESVENEVNHEQPESVQFAVRHNEQDKVHQASSESDGRNQPELSERDISCIQQDKATITLLEEISIEQQLSTATKSGHTNPCNNQAIHRDLYDISPHHITTTKIENEDLYFLTSDNSREDSSLLEINQDDSEIYEDATSSNMKMTVIESEPSTVAKADVVHNTETVVEVVANETENFLKSESADKDQPSSMRSTSEDDLPGIQSKESLASGMQSTYGLTFGMQSKDDVVSGMQSKDIIASEIQSKDGITSGMPSKDDVASGMQSNYGLTFGMQSKYIIAPGMQSKDRDTSAMSSKDNITSGKQSKDDPPPGMQSKRCVDSGMQSNYDLTFGMQSKVVSEMQSKDNITSRMQSKDILASAMPSKDNLPSGMESKFGLTFGMPSKDNIGSEMQFQGGIASERQSNDGIVSGPASESQSGSVDLDVLEPKENIVATSVETARKDNMFKATGSGDAHPTKSADRSATIETSPTAVSKSSIVTGVDMKTSSLTVDQMTKNIFSALSVLQFPVSAASETLVSSSDTLGKPKTSDQSDLRNVADIPLPTSGPSTSSATSQSILFVPPSRELKFSQLKDSRFPNSSSKPKDAPSLKSLSTESLSLVGLAKSRSTVQPATSHVPSSPAVRYDHGNGASLPASPNRQPKKDFPPPGFIALLSSGTTCTTTTTSTISSSWYMNNSSGPVGTPVPIRPPPGFSSVPPINPMYMAVPPGPMGFSPMQISYPNMYAYPQYNMIRPGPMQTTFIPQSQGLQQAYPYGLSAPSQINQNTGVTPGTRGAQTGNTESTGDPSIIQIGNVCGTSFNPSTFYCQANNLRQSSTNAPMSSSKSASGNQNVLNQMAACADKVAQASGSTNASKHNKPVVEKIAPSVTTAPTQATKTKKTKTPLSLRDILTDFRDEGDRDSDLEDDTFFDKPSSVKKIKPSKKDNPNGDRIRTLSERSNESRPRTLSQQSNESNLTEKGTQPKTGKKLVHLVNTSVHNGQTSSSIKKAVQLVNSSIDSGQASSSNSGSSGWTEVVRKSLAMKTYPILSTSLAGSFVSKTCGQRLLEHLIARFPSETSETLISLVKTVRRKHGKTLTGLSFELIETEVRLLLMKRQQQTRKDPDSASSGWEKFKGKAWGDTPCVQKTVEWQSSSQDNCSICLCPMRSYTTTLDCQHMFHTECIKDWFRKKSVCPFCMKYCTLNEEFPTLC